MKGRGSTMAGINGPEATETRRLGWDEHSRRFGEARLERAPRRLGDLATRIERASRLYRARQPAAAAHRPCDGKPHRAGPACADWRVLMPRRRGRPGARAAPRPSPHTASPFRRRALPRPRWRACICTAWVLKPAGHRRTARASIHPWKVAHRQSRHERDGHWGCIGGKGGRFAGRAPSGRRCTVSGLDAPSGRWHTVLDFKTSRVQSSTVHPPPPRNGAQS